MDKLDKKDISQHIFSLPSCPKCGKREVKFIGRNKIVCYNCNFMAIWGINILKRSNKESLW